ncbi:MAG: DNA metabolism protein [Clostridiales bacterium]|nr:DNA metabolism protein [Clostridiales bacterium]
MRRIYRIDKSLESFFTAVFYAYNDKNAYLTSAEIFQPELEDTIFRLESESDKAERVQRTIYKTDPKAKREIERILRSNHFEREQIAFEYLKLVIKHGKSARERLTISAVRRAMDEVKKVGHEVHRLHGFLRFQECENGVYYGACSPDNDILELLIPHFVARFTNQAFIIHDVKRGKAVLYNGEKYLVVPAKNASFHLTEREKSVVALWKKYYHTVAIPKRKNLRLMKNYMPVRYWKYMCEKDADDLR